MKSSGVVYIAGNKTIDDWRLFRKALVSGSASASWQKAYEDYFFTRLSLRYLEPIQVLQENGTFRGEGFSILAIQCSLIEFLESTVQGLSYRYRRRGDALGAPLEFVSRQKVRNLYPQGLRDLIASHVWNEGEYTDDTQMGLLIAESLLQNKGLVACDLAKRFHAWAATAKDVGREQVDLL